MTSRNPIQPSIEAAAPARSDPDDPSDPGGSPHPGDPSPVAASLEGPSRSEASVESFREVLSHWASGVTVVATREPDGTIHATTVTSFASISVEPPRILVSLGSGAQVLPFVEEGQRFVVNILSKEQGRVATVFADAYPVGPSPFPSSGDPVAAGAHAALICAAERVIPVDSVRLVLGRVLEAKRGEGIDPLVHYRREYRSLRE